jgi:hypothetical protein
MRTVAQKRARAKELYQQNKKAIAWKRKLKRCGVVLKQSQNGS